MNGYWLAGWYVILMADIVLTLYIRNQKRQILRLAQERKDLERLLAARASFFPLCAMLAAQRRINRLRPPIAGRNEGSAVNPDFMVPIPEDGQHCTREQAARLLQELREVFQQLPPEHRAVIVNLLHEPRWSWVH